VPHDVHPEPSQDAQPVVEKPQEPQEPPSPQAGGQPPTGQQPPCPSAPYLQQASDGGDPDSEYPGWQPVQISLPVISSNAHWPHPPALLHCLHSAP
jgi:hypothetical protein